ncbi:hypothetical protein COV05_02485 [Candidatus Uhrbacteria bacterium CG10_big_fil_rev_8_21_14_0_10_48_16]|uniref:Uncharacterized protein n=1 Tax=Candidatus Uhrbacteria bacterium CG10_big_fil_rev_8_21_14_0_10_48_16 TaxID=1975038 RepID=A0A2M8LH85_9BACT|nr:MAG: hypothetical protein COV05_02485 [Candidatus Uhrbacteria bacterium CG10_big_fil_rev_8_21_14_0_10_48_16]
MPWFILRLLALKTIVLSCTKKLSHTKLRAGGIFVFSFLLLFAGLPAHAAELDVDSILKIFADFAFSIAGVLTKMIVLLIDTMVPIMTYNNFTGNPVVKAGWAIVRDTVNMFFVIVLIIIAFGTIFGNQRFKWQQQVPRLLIFAIVINFSKTLCGIMIDFGQVIMLTFANALREIAAGNFIQLLGLNEIYSVSANSSVTAVTESGSTGAGTSFDFFAAGVASVILTLWVLGTLIILVAILLFRIIMLWVLVVLAPLAWFMGGVAGKDGIISSNAYAEWWNEFKCLVAVGPVLMFFLWLTLAVAGAGNIAANSGFVVSADSNNADFTSSLLELNNFLSFLIGMAMLMAGFKAATQFCSGMSGDFIGKAVGKAKGVPSLAKGVALTGAGLGLKGGARGLQLGARGLQLGAGGLATGAGAVATGARYLPGSAAVGRGISTVRGGVKNLAYTAVEKAGKVPGFGAVERFGARKKGESRDQEGIRRVAEIKKQQEGLKGQSRDTVAALGKKYADRPPSGTAAQAEAMAILDQAMGDSRLQKTMRADGSLQKLWEQYGKQFEKDFSHDSEKMGAVKGFKKSNADITKSADLITDADDAKGLQAGAWEDKAVQERMSKIQTQFKGDDGKNLTAMGAARAGHYGTLAQGAAVKGADVSKMEVGAQFEDQMARALQTEDAGSAQKVIAELAKRYEDPGTSAQDRQKMDRSMERMRNSMTKRHGQSASDQAFAQFETTRSGVESNPANLAPAPELPSEGSVDEFVGQSFGGASQKRIDQAVSKYSTDEAGQKTAVDDLTQKLAQVEAEAGAQSEAVKRMRETIQARRASIESKTGQEVDAAYQELEAARKGLATAKAKGGKGSGVARAQAHLEKKQSAYTTSVASAKTEVEADSTIRDLEKQIDEELRKSQSEEVVKQAETDRKALAQAQEKLKRLTAARKKLEERRKTT